MTIEKNKDITSLTTLRIKSKADFYLKAESVNNIKHGIEFAKEKKIKFIIIGNGSNVLFKNKVFHGLIIQIALNQMNLEKNILQAGAGVKLPVLADFCQKHEITGFEHLAHIPGTVGGAVYMNAGAFGFCIADNLIQVKVLNAETGKIRDYKKSELNFDYKYAMFQDQPELIILKAYFKIKKLEKKKIQEKTQEYFEHRKTHQPISQPTLGCTFKNPLINRELKSAGQFLDQAGCKGLQIGDAGVSMVHANFIINKGSAKTKDILKLINLMQKKVKNKFNIKLKKEIKIISSYLETNS